MVLPGRAETRVLFIGARAEVVGTRSNGRMTQADIGGGTAMEL